MLCLSLTESPVAHAAVFDCVRLPSFAIVFYIHISISFLSYMLKHVQEVFFFFFFFLAAVKKKLYIYIYSISYWSEVNIIIIKPQFDLLHHQEEKALKRLVEVEI